jgi:hypothetical protein
VLGVAGQFRYTVIQTANTYCHHMYTIPHYLPPLILYYLWCGPCSTRRQARELISGPNLATRARLLSFNRTQTRVVIGLLTGHNTLRRHSYVMGPSDNPTCRKCGIEEASVPHFVSVRLQLHSYIHIWVPSFWRI